MLQKSDTTFTLYGYDHKYFSYRSFKFPGGEIQVVLGEEFRNFNPEGAVMYIEGSIWSSDALMELFVLTDALRRKDFLDISLNLGYCPYGQQDRVCAPGEALSACVVATLINAMNYETVSIQDPHSPVLPALIRNSRIVRLVDLVESRVLSIPELGLGVESVIVAPDAGARARASEVAARYKHPLVQGHKSRNPMDGKITGTSIVGGEELVAGKRAVIVDDLCIGGGTFIPLAKLLKEKGATEVLLVVSHGIFSNGFGALTEHIDKIYTFNLSPSFVKEESIPSQLIVL